MSGLAERITRRAVESLQRRDASLAEEVFVKRARLGDLEGVPDATHLLASSELPARSPAVAVGLLVHGRSLLLPAAVPQVRERRRRAGLWTRISRKVLAKRGGGS